MRAALPASGLTSRRRTKTLRLWEAEVYPGAEERPVRYPRCEQPSFWQGFRQQQYFRRAKILMMLQAGLSPIIFGAVGRAMGNQHQLAEST